MKTWSDWHFWYNSTGRHFAFLTGLDFRTSRIIAQNNRKIKADFAAMMAERFPVQGEYRTEHEAAQARAAQLRNAERFSCEGIRMFDK
jgi:hypothetical protein